MAFGETAAGRLDAGEGDVSGSDTEGLGESGDEEVLGSRSEGGGGVALDGEGESDLGAGGGALARASASLGRAALVLVTGEELAVVGEEAKAAVALYDGHLHALFLVEGTGNEFALVRELVLAANTGADRLVVGVRSGVRGSV